MTGRGKIPASFKDITGQRFTRLVVVSRAGSDSNGNAKWNCLCDCGNATTSSGFTLRNGEAKSCGCLTTEQLIARATTHKKSHDAEYRCWAGMLQRCDNPKTSRYSRYGGRGIKVCERWYCFEDFYADMGPRPTRDHSIERINNDGNYTPGNCRWATSKEQNHNKSSNRIVEYRGQEMPLQTAIELANSPVNRNTVQGRLRRGWSVALAIEAPPRSLPNFGYWPRAK